MGPLADAGEWPAIPRLRAVLLRWYRRNKRDLPWRDTPDPYAIWVSEAMLQQTQVATVIPYYERFVREFPTLADLAQAPLDRVLLLWSGLGYYSRARNLHAAARQVMAEHGGQLPSDPKALRALPGVGEYTAGAILSLAFGVRVPCVDGNVERVLCRALEIAGDPKRQPARRTIRAAASALADCRAPGEMNQALMELGATICTPAQADCPDCPLRRRCLAKAHGTDRRLPETSARSPQTGVRTAAALIRREGRVLLAQRGADGVWAGLWEFPQVAVSGGDAAAELVHYLGRELGLVARVGPALLEVRHGLMNQSVRMQVLDCLVVHGEPDAGSYAAVAWVPPEDIPGLALSAPHRKAARQLLRERW